MHTQVITSCQISNGICIYIFFCICKCLLVVVVGGAWKKAPKDGNGE